MDPETPAPTPSSAGSSSSQLTSDDAAFRALALRLLAQHMPYTQMPETQVELLVGQLPESFPSEIPFPDGSRVAGSLVRSEHVTAVLDADQPPDAVQDFYQERMPAAGWAMPDRMGPRRGGFMPSGPFGRLPLLFCRGEQGPALHVHVQERANEPTEVRLELVTYTDNPEHSPCAQRLRDRPRQSTMDLIPAVYAPPHGRQQGGGGTSSDDFAATTARLDVALDVVALSAHYTRQLQQAGWAPTGEGASGPVAWSTWSVADEQGGPWTGIFVALEHPDRPGRFFLTLQIVSAGQGTPGTGKGGASWSVVSSTTIHSSSRGPTTPS